MVAGPADDETTAIQCTINEGIWGVEAPVIFLNAEDGTLMADAIGSTDNVATAKVTMYNAVKRLEYHSSKHHVITSPYNAREDAY